MYLKDFMKLTLSQCVAEICKHDFSKTSGRIYQRFKSSIPM